MFGPDEFPGGCDLTTASGGGEAQGQRIVVWGTVLDERGRPVPHTLLEIWQANAAGRYLHRWDQHHAPLDPNFSGQGYVLTDEQGRYRFVTIRPGCYPWRNHYNAWRPAHIHFSLLGPAIATRLVTQMYFAGDPLLSVDPIFNCTADEKARNRLIAQLDWESTQPDEAIGFRFDIVLRGPDETPMETS
jgi:protocatechuate 3,4-dioxygenase beta subunit